MDAMDQSMHDEDNVWRRAFADSMGLFDNLSYGPLPVHNSNLAGAGSMAHFASPPAQEPILAPPTPSHINAVLVPSPAQECTPPAAQQALLSCPTLVGSSIIDELPTLAPHPAPSTGLGAAGGLGSTGRDRHVVGVPVQSEAVRAVQSEAVRAAQAAARQVSDEDAHQASTVLGPGKHGSGPR